jgi:hypothetical protein
VGDPEPRLVDLSVPIEQEIEIERPRPLGRDGSPVAAEPGLDGEEQVEERGSRQHGVEGRDPVQEAGLIHIADRFRIDQRGDGDDLDSFGGLELRHRRADGRLAVAEVGTEPDICPGHRASLARLARVVGRRFLAVCALALCLGGTATASVLHSAADPLEPQEWWLAAVGADPAAAPPAGLPITIVDSGTDPTHPDFAGRPATTVLNDQTTTGIGEYHGTMVASIAAAPENGVDLVGVYPTAALQIFDASPGTQGISDLAATTAIETAHCPGVINLSFGSASPDPQLHDAILDAVHNGCLVVAAAGNFGQEGSPPVYPASWPHVFTVAATDEHDAVAPFSSISPDTDIAAPGVDILGDVPLTRDPNGYQQGSGTSFAAPIVTAAAAWIWTLRPTLTASQLAAVLRAGARDIGPPGFDNASGAGIVNIPASLTAPAPPTDPGEPNDDIDQVKPGDLFQLGESPLTTVTRPSGRIAATLSAAEDPRDLYRIWVPAHKIVRVAVTSGGRAAARIWGSQTVSVQSESNADRRRDLRGQSVRALKKGFAAYVEVLLTGRSTDASYVLTVKAARR